MPSSTSENVLEMNSEFLIRLSFEFNKFAVSTSLNCISASIYIAISFSKLYLFFYTAI